MDCEGVACAQPITLRLGSVVLEGAVGLDVKMFEYNSWNYMKNELGIDRQTEICM